MTITDSKEFDIRYTLPDDAKALTAWLQKEQMRHWYPPNTREEVETFIRVWMGFMRVGACLSAVYQGQIIGMGVLYLMPYRKVAHQSMMQVIVDPKWQRQGVGRSLVRNLSHLAKNYFRLELLSAEVFGDSLIIPLLESLDFATIFGQKGYLKEGDQYISRTFLEKQL